MIHHLPKSIQRIIQKVNELPMVENHLLEAIIQDAAPTEAELNQFAYFDHPKQESYGRRMLYQNDQYRIFLMSWSKGDFTAIHNHGCTEWGCVYFFGEATHRLYEVESGRLELAESANFPNGAIANVCGDLTHLMGNASQTSDYMSLHVYGTNSHTDAVLQNAKVYFPEQEELKVTMGAAYLNICDSLVVDKQTLSTPSKTVLTDYFNLVKPFYERNQNWNILRNMDRLLLN